MPKPNDLCKCGHPYKRHRGKGGACTLTTGTRGINTKETGEKGKAAIQYLGTICPCEEFSLGRKE